MNELTQLRQFTFTNLENATLLGSPLLEGAALEAALDTQWIAPTDAEPPELPHSAKQRKWDRPLLERVMDEMADSLPSASDQASWRAVTAPHAEDWLLAMPIASCGLKLDDEAVRVAVGLRLGTNLCEPHTCVCGERVTAQGHHGLSCIRGFGKQ